MTNLGRVVSWNEDVFPKTASCWLELMTSLGFLKEWSWESLLSCCCVGSVRTSVEGRKMQAQLERWSGRVDWSICECSFANTCPDRTLEQIYGRRPSRLERKFFPRYTFQAFGPTVFVVGGRELQNWPKGEEPCPLNRR